MLKLNIFESLGKFFDKLLNKDEAEEVSNSIENLKKSAPKKQVVMELAPDYLREMGFADKISGLAHGGEFKVDISFLDEADRFILADINYSAFFEDTFLLKNIKREVISGKVRYRISPEQNNRDGFGIFVEITPNENGAIHNMKVFFETDRFIYDNPEEWGEFYRTLNRSRFNPKELENDLPDKEFDEDLHEDYHKKTKTEFLKDHDFKSDKLNTKRVLGDYDFDPKDFSSNFTDYDIDREVQYKAGIVVKDSRDDSTVFEFDEFVRYVVFNEGSFASLYIGYNIDIERLKFN